jgi:antitoxin component of MazEF toxin-antitoxin module
MVKTLTKHGNSMALIIEKPILELIGAGPDTQFDVTTDGDALVLSPVRNPRTPSKFRAALDSVNKRYSKALKRLSQ